MPPRTEAALVEHALEVVSESARVIAANSNAVELSEQARLQGLADRDEALAKLADAKEAVRDAAALIRHIRLQAAADRDEALAVVADAKEAVRDAVALIRHLRAQLDDRPPMPHIAPSHPLHLATADLLKSREGRVALVLLAAALALSALTLALTAGLDPHILSELAP